jgi:uncharacterized C2H2 Zn-finger protein
MEDGNLLLVECPQCGWVHFAVDEDYVKQWEDDWAKFWPTLDEKGREAYGLPDGPPSRDEFLKCFVCGNRDRSLFYPSSKNMDGHTIQPILMDRV